MNFNLLLFWTYTRVIHIVGISGIEPLLGFLKSTLTFKTSILPLGYGDHNTILYI
jgi:hypothetical protein